MCDHSGDATLISAFGGGREIWMCQCGALLDGDSKESRPMTPDEVNALVINTVQKLLVDKVEVVKARIIKALKEMEGA